MPRDRYLKTMYLVLNTRFRVHRDEGWGKHIPCPTICIRARPAP